MHAPTTEIPAMATARFPRLPRHALAATTLATLALAGCAGRDAATRPAEPVATVAGTPVMPAANTGGAIYQPASALLFFHDAKARRVGDVLTVRLNERTQASKSNSTDAAKTSALEMGAPVLLGNTVTRNGLPLTNTVETSQEFSGRGASTQSNRLDGSVTVIVTEVLPSGNLRIEGEKQLTLNQGEEYIRVQGIVRPTDIGTDNSVSSLEIADAKITYSGKGPLNDANRPGILTRLFLRFWPL
jgi:flagellar L-ring protein precursor FlgH